MDSILQGTLELPPGMSQNTSLEYSNGASDKDQSDTEIENIHEPPSPRTPSHHSPHTAWHPQSPKDRRASAGLSPARQSPHTTWHLQSPKDRRASANLALRGLNQPERATAAPLALLDRTAFVGSIGQEDRGSVGSGIVGSVITRGASLGSGDVAERKRESRVSFPGNVVGRRSCERSSRKGNVRDLVGRSASLAGSSGERSSAEEAELAEVRPARASWALSQQKDLLPLGDQSELAQRSFKRWALRTNPRSLVTGTVMGGIVCSELAQRSFKRWVYEPTPGALNESQDCIYLRAERVLTNSPLYRNIPTTDQSYAGSAGIFSQRTNPEPFYGVFWFLSKSFFRFKMRRGRVGIAHGRGTASSSGGDCTWTRTGKCIRWGSHTDEDVGKFIWSALCNTSRSQLFQLGTSSTHLGASNLAPPQSHKSSLSQQSINMAEAEGKQADGDAPDAAAAVAAAPEAEAAHDAQTPLQPPFKMDTVTPPDWSVVRIYLRFLHVIGPL
eukprot:1192281-Prorocentrum_minimum.AAC.1